MKLAKNKKDRERKTILLLMMLVVLVMILTASLMKTRAEARKICEEECSLRGQQVASCSYSYGLTRVNVRFTCSGYRHLNISLPL